MRSSKVAADDIKESLRAQCTPAEFEKLFGDVVGNVESIALSTRALAVATDDKCMSPRGDVYAFAETLIRRARRNDADKLGVVSSLFVRQESAYKALREHHRILSGIVNKDEATPAFKEKMSPSIYRAATWLAARIGGEGSATVYHCKLISNPLTVNVVKLEVYYAILAAKDRPEVVRCGDPCLCGHWSAHGKWCSCLLAALNVHTGLPVAECYSPPPSETVKEALVAMFGPTMEMPPLEAAATATLTPDDLLEMPQVNPPTHLLRSIAVDVYPGLASSNSPSLADSAFAQNCRPIAHPPR